MKHIYFFFRNYLFLILLYIFPVKTYPEGSKEVYIGGNNTFWYLCNDFAGQCFANGGLRTQFAIYG